MCTPHGEQRSLRIGGVAQDVSDGFGCCGVWLKHPCVTRSEVVSALRENADTLNRRATADGALRDLLAQASGPALRLADFRQAPGRVARSWSDPFQEVCRVRGIQLFLPVYEWCL